MGTDVRIVVDADDCKELKKSIAAAFGEGARLNQILSDWEADSELSRFSRSSQFGNKFALSNELMEVLTFSQNLAYQSNGAFDVTVGPLSRMWRIARHQKRIPETKKILQTLLRTGYKKLLIDESNRSARLTTQGMVLDLGGVAKGYIADQMLGVMKSHGFSRCLIDAGGDLTIGNPPRQLKGWKVEFGGIANSLVPVHELSNCAVATSGDFEQFLELEGKRYSHLIDPKTGTGIEGQVQVTVIAKNGMTADALASTCLVLGIEKSKAFLAKSQFLSMYYVRANNSSQSPEFFEVHSHKFHKKL